MQLRHQLSRMRAMAAEYRCAAGLALHIVEYYAAVTINDEFVRAGIDRLPLPPRRAAVDTTGAGDSFNAGWLAARRAGAAPADAIARAAALAAQVVLHPGAILPRHAMPSPEEISA